MPALPFVAELFGWRKGIPNIADKSSVSSVSIAEHMLGQLGVEAVSTLSGQGLGAKLEESVKDFLLLSLPGLDTGRSWAVERGRAVTEFAQYEHLAKLQSLIDQDASGTLSVEIGRDYEVAPDVTVGLNQPLARPVLHAAVSCKFTIRSDRVQNIRHEAVILTRHRRGRQPHIVAVTCEPQPTRLAAIARGTGEIDALYHVALDELVTATTEAGNDEQRSVLDEIVGQGRLYDLADLPATLTV
jgi:hypothetical protein